MANLFHNRRFKITMTIFGSLVLLFLIFGAFHYSKGNRINAYLQARAAPSGSVFENIKEYLVWADTNEQMTNDDAKYTNFTRFSKSDLAIKRQDLKAANSDSAVYVKSVGRRFWIFPDYRIAIKPMALTIRTNVPNVDVLLNDKKVTVSNSEDFSVKLERLPTADYTASINGYHNERKINVKKTFDGTHSVLDLSVTFKNFSVTSNVKEGELYFDENRVGTLREGKFQVDHYPVTDTAQAYIKKTFPDGDLKSSKHPLVEVAEGSNLEIMVSNLLNEEKAGQLLVSAFDQLMGFLNTGQDSTTLGNVFEAGANNDFYKGLKESIKSKFQTDTRKATSLNIPSILLNKMTQIGKTSYLLDFSAIYEFVYDKSTDPAKQTSGYIRQELTGKMTLKKVGAHYLVSQTGSKNITVTNETNHVKGPSIFPESLLGTWTGQKEAFSVSMTLAKDGTITTKFDFKDGRRANETKTAKITKVQEKGNGLFLYTPDPSSDIGALIPGAGLGGVNVKYAYGFRVNGNTASPIVWQAASNSAFDYSKPMVGMTLTKQ
ncbi:zinc ribbon domain-containing protein [Streptococcus castoreus]|nr:hypothetical protein [Streptococcus castoreus]